jgi:heme/copper-type cytochrome/quinol oxidase subunit 2
MKTKRLLIITFALFLVMPVMGCFLRNGWLHFPPGYGLFPAQKATEDPPFNLHYFITMSIVCLFVLIFLLFPRLFGFKKATTEPTLKTNTQYPPWFVPAIVVTLISWFLMWGRYGFNSHLDYFTFVPLWWGFIFVLDSVVYKRNNGISLVSSRPNTLKLMAVVSSFSWFVFEFQNFFVNENWYYPNAQILTNFGNISWQLLSYTTVLPAIFEWYCLLRTIPPLKARYSSGPKINFSTPTLYVFLVVGLLLSLLMGYFPNPLFWMLWVSLIPALIPAMVISGYWTPITPIIKKGDWSPVVLIALSTLLNGFFWEFWNFGSEWFHDDLPSNPNYWRYSVPYVDVFHIFSQMPILGYFGYLFFGIGCWVLWVIVAHIADFNPSIHDEDETTVTT